MVRQFLAVAGRAVSIQSDPGPHRQRPVRSWATLSMSHQVASSTVNLPIRWWKVPSMSKSGRRSHRQRPVRSWAVPSRSIRATDCNLVMCQRCRCGEMKEFHQIKVMVGHVDSLGETYVFDTWCRAHATSNLHSTESLPLRKCVDESNVYM